MRNQKWNRELREEFQRLRKMRDAHARGRLFERLFLDLATRDGLKVRQNVRAARPRQTDLFVSVGDKDCIVEAKWTKKKADSDVIDAVRSRLDRVPQDVIACVLSWSGYSDSAVREVERDRKREILLFDGAEIESIFSDAIAFTDLFELKRKAFREDGIVLFVPRGGRSEDQPDWYLERTAPFKPVIVDTSDRYFFGTRVDQDALLTTELLHGFPYGGVRVAIRSEADSLDRVQELMAIVEHELHLNFEDDGVFGISQIGYSWFGRGGRRFLRELRRVNERNVEGNLTTLHHSEDAHFRIQSGDLTLMFGLRQGSHGEHIDRVELEIHCPGVPVFSEGYRRIAEAFGDRYCAFEVPRYEDYQRKVARVQLALHVEHQIVRSGEPWPRAVIARNPFWRRPVPKHLDRAGLSDIRNCEHIICDVKYAPPGVANDEFVLVRVMCAPSIDVRALYFEAVWAGDLEKTAMHQNGPRRKRPLRMRQRRRS